MGWLIAYGVGAACMAFLMGAALTNGWKGSGLQIVVVLALWPVVLPMSLGAILLGGDD